MYSYYITAHHRWPDSPEFTDFPDSPEFTDFPDSPELQIFLAVPNLQIFLTVPNLKIFLHRQCPVYRFSWHIEVAVSRDFYKFVWLIIN